MSNNTSATRPADSNDSDDSDEKWIVFRGLLDAEYEWPSKYLFKFIVPCDGLAHVEVVLADAKRTVRASKRGNYFSVTAHYYADSAEAVINIYKSASTIPGVISL